MALDPANPLPQESGTPHAPSPARREPEGGVVKMAKNAARVGPRFPQVVVLFGATGDLSRRKLLPGLFHLVQRRASFPAAASSASRSTTSTPTASARSPARRSTQFSTPQGRTRPTGRPSPQTLDYVPLAAGAGALEGGGRAGASSRSAARAAALHYLSVPPNAALAGGAHCWRRPASSSAAASSWKSPSAPTSRARCR